MGCQLSTFRNRANLTRVRLWVARPIGFATGDEWRTHRWPTSVVWFPSPVGHDRRPRHFRPFSNRARTGRAAAHSTRQIRTSIRNDQAVAEETHSRDYYSQGSPSLSRSRSLSACGSVRTSRCSVGESASKFAQLPSKIRSLTPVIAPTPYNAAAASNALATDVPMVHRESTRRSRGLGRVARGAGSLMQTNCTDAAGHLHGEPTPLAATSTGAWQPGLYAPFGGAACPSDWSSTVTRRHIPGLRGNCGPRYL